MRLVGLDLGHGGLPPFDVGRQVINFDMPKEIENYVHRIGRTGSLESFSISHDHSAHTYSIFVAQPIVQLRGSFRHVWISRNVP